MGKKKNNSESVSLENADFGNKESKSVITLDHVPSTECVKKIKKKHPGVVIKIPDGREI